MSNPKDFVIKNGVLEKYKGRDSDVVVHEGVTSVGDGAFSECSSLTSVKLPDGLTSIENGAFKGCANLTSVNLPEGLKSIGQRAFSGCKKLADENGFVIVGGILFNYYGTGGDIVVPDGVTSIENGVFKGRSSLTSVNLPEGLTSIRNNAFSGCKNLTSVALPDGLTSIGYAAFSECSSLTNVTIPGSVTNISDSAFYCCRSLESVTIGNGVKRIESDAFFGCSGLTSVTISDSVTSIGREAFSCTGLTSIIIPDNVTIIGGRALYECSALKYIILKGYKVAIDSEAFANCKALKAIIYLNPLPAFARCQQADDAELAELLAELRSLEKDRSERDLLLYARGAVMLNDNIAAMRYAQKVGLLDAYAEVRGVDVDMLIESKINDFGLDSTGKKTWMLAGRALTATLNSDFTLTLSDETGKLLRSVPKKGADEDAYKAVKDEFAAMKKNIKTAAKARNDSLFEDFLSGRVRDAASWQKAYLRNSMLRVMGRLIVWDQDGATFTLDNHGQPIRSDGSAYTITDCGIRVAHPMEMTKEDADAWRHYYSSRALKQPFEQVWEPVAVASLVNPGRYDGYTVPLYVLMNQERHGIVMNGQSEITLKDCSAEIKFVKGHHEWVKNEFEVRSFKFGKYTRQVNHIVALLDKATVADRIIKDDVIAAQWFDRFTLAQFTGFIADAQEAKANNVLALLLDYKEKTFPDFDPMDEFTLEW